MKTIFVYDRTLLERYNLVHVTDAPWYAMLDMSYVLSVSVISGSPLQRARFWNAVCSLQWIYWLWSTRCSIWVDEEFIKEQLQTRPNEILAGTGVWGLVALLCRVQQCSADAPTPWDDWFHSHSNALLTANAADQEDVHVLTRTPPFANHSVFLT